MKSIGKLLIAALVLVIAGTGVMNGQRGMRGERPDSAGRGRPGYPGMHMRYSEMPQDSAIMQMRHQMQGMRMHMRSQADMMRRHLEMWHAPMNRMYPPMAWGPGFRGGYGPGQFNRPDLAQQAPGLRRLETIPNLTEKQKKDIAELNKKHQYEMQKFREETSSKVRDMRESQRKKVMDLLTDEQKKYMEENFPAPPATKK